MARVAIKDFTQEPPTVLAEYELQNDVAVAVVGGDSLYVEDLEDDGVALTLPDGTEKFVFPEDGEAFMEGLFWTLNRQGSVNASGVDAEGKAIGARYVSALKKLMAGAAKK